MMSQLNSFLLIRLSSIPISLIITAGLLSKNWIIPINKHKPKISIPQYSTLYYYP